MAYPVEFKGANTRYGPPPGREEDVESMVVMKGQHGLVSCWQLSETELAEVIRTGRIYHLQWGTSLTPMFIGGEKNVREVALERGMVLPRQEE